MKKDADREKKKAESDFWETYSGNKTTGGDESDMKRYKAALDSERSQIFERNLSSLLKETSENNNGGDKTKEENPKAEGLDLHWNSKNSPIRSEINVSCENILEDIKKSYTNGTKMNIISSSICGNIRTEDLPMDTVSETKYSTMEKTENDIIRHLEEKLDNIERQNENLRNTLEIYRSKLKVYEKYLLKEKTEKIEWRYFTECIEKGLKIVSELKKETKKDDYSKEIYSIRNENAYLKNVLDSLIKETEGQKT